jgi:hypothetical protein
MQEVNAQMVLKLHQMSGEPVANCHYLLAQTKGDYELALKILERILEQRKNADAEPPAPEAATDAALQSDPQPGIQIGAPLAPDERLDMLESRMSQLEARFMQLADSLDLLNQRLGALLDKVSDADAADADGAS